MVEMWQFDTAKFSVVWYIEESQDLDLSWDDTGEAERNIRSGLWTAFDSKMAVYFQGTEIGADYLGESIYENPSEFRSHIGSKGSYFPDMVREAISQARKFMAEAKTA